MISRQTFFDRLRYGKHRFENDDYVYAKPHINPDGAKGGWVAETALVEPTCYISPGAEVYEYAQVRENSRILGSSSACGFAKIAGNAVLDDWSIAFDDACIQGSAYIGNTAVICGKSFIDFGVIDKDKTYKNLRQVLKD